MTVCGKLECVEEYNEIIDKITTEDIKNTAEKYLNLNKAVIAVLMPDTYNK